MRAVLAGLGLMLIAFAARAENIVPIGRVFEAATGIEITEAELIERLGAAELVILGEIHDNHLHHRLQARLVAALQPGGLAFEQIPGNEERVVNGLLRHGTDPYDIGEAIGWADLGWPEWREYGQIIAAAPDAYIAAGGVERDDLMTAMRHGAADAFGPNAPDWGLHIDFVPEVMDALEAEMIAAHCNMMPPEMAPGMVEAQRLRDAHFAAALLRAQTKGGNDRAVLITGNGHARKDWGVPRYTAAMGPEIPILVVGMVEGDGTPEPGLPYDFVVVTRASQREDPCESLRKS